MVGTVFNAVKTDARISLMRHHRYSSTANTGQFLHRINVSILSQRRQSDSRPVTVEVDDSGTNVEDE